jgi:hypothetical protein
MAFNVPEAIGGVTSGASKAIGNIVPDPLQDLFGNVPTDGIPAQGSVAQGSFNDDAIDWRVKLSIPSSFKEKKQNSGTDSEFDPGIVAPLFATNGLVFPYTPNIYIAYTANYDKLSPTHSNYPFPIYQNSAVDQFVITGTFTAENASEGAYWIAANQYLRSITKMAYGESSNRGAPPPVVKLNGYGDYIFNNVPVVVEQYTVTLPEDVDYIQVPGVGPNGSYVPTRSEISVTVFPTYSRNSVNKFNLDKFIKGEYISQGGGGKYI